MMVKNAKFIAIEAQETGNQLTMSINMICIETLFLSLIAQSNQYAQVY